MARDGHGQLWWGGRSWRWRSIQHRSQSSHEERPGPL